MDQRQAAFRFSAIFHFALKRHLYESMSLLDTFLNEWDRYLGSDDIVYREGESWLGLRELGIMFCGLFVKQYNHKITPIFAETGAKVDGKIVRPDFIGMDEHDCFTYMEYKVTAKPVDLSEIMAQLVRGAAYVQQQFSSDEPVRVIVANFIKSEVRLEWREIYVTSEDIEGHRGIQDDFEETARSLFS
jgi:hypothetical protein